MGTGIEGMVMARTSMGDTMIMTGVAIVSGIGAAETLAITVHRSI
jgi:hypothetical protein